MASSNSATSKILVNTRCVTAGLTGVQRYTTKILEHITLRQVAPTHFSQGVQGHIWEQMALPLLAKNRLLFSPSNTGPLLVKDQIVTIMDASTLDHPEWFSPKFASWYQLLLPKLAHRVRKILTISEFSKDRIVKKCGVNPEKIIVTYLAADQQFSPKSKAEISNIREHTGIPAEHYFLALGSLEPRKNLERLLAAWATTIKYLPDNFWLVLAGAKGKGTIFREIAFENLPKRVHFTGYVPDEYLPALLSGANAFLYPSIYEGFGLPPLEAMACGTPVLTSNATALPEVVGDAAFLVDPYDVDSISSGIKQLVEDSTLREQLKLKGLERAKKFTWEQTAEQTLRVLQETAGDIK